jgi:hypothetical protein
MLGVVIRFVATVVFAMAIWPRIVGSALRQDKFKQLPPLLLLGEIKGASIVVKQGISSEIAQS